VREYGNEHSDISPFNKEDAGITNTDTTRSLLPRFAYPKKIR
jgi:hypothetical protein